jgi:hypothetical protein
MSFQIDAGAAAGARNVTLIGTSEHPAALAMDIARADRET